MAQKQSIDKCLAEYTDKELIEFHANLNAIFMCCTEDYKVFRLLLAVTFAISQRSSRGVSLCTKYLKAFDNLISVKEVK